MMRIVYFGSREWLDVPPHWTLARAQRELRTAATRPSIGFCAGYVYKGPRYRAVEQQMRADALAHHFAICPIVGRADGADLLAEFVANELCLSVRTFAIDPKLDGTAQWAPFRRNERMDREGRPDAGRCFCVGARGTALTPGSAHMLSLLQRRGVPVIVHRDDGVEPQQTSLFG